MWGCVVELDRARLQLFVVPPVAEWEGTVDSYDSSAFALTVTTTSGTFPTDIANLLLVRKGSLVRVRSRASQVLTLAENQVAFASGDAVAIYNARLPWPRYQRITGGTVYKDFDIPFPTPWQGELPPTALLKSRIDGSTNDWSEAVYCAVDEAVALDAGDSYINVGSGLISQTWTPGTDGTITGSGDTVTVAYSSSGFRYLKLGLTDPNSTQVARYLPIWVGVSPTVGVTRCDARWDVRAGWVVDLELEGELTLLQYTPAIVVDVETGNVVFFGFIVPTSRELSFERITTAVTLQSALAFSRFLHAYPFVVTDLRDAETPDDWSEVYELTLARALWFLIYWHSTLPEVVNVDLSDAPERDIAGQEFNLGSLPQQVAAICQSAFWQARGARAGGLRVLPDPLFLEEDEWLTISGFDLTDAENLRQAIRVEYGQPVVNQARLSGVYRTLAGDYAPAIVQAPVAPGPWGSPSEVNNLAPEDAAELQLWAGRYVAVENSADTYNVQPGLDVEPAAWRVADLLSGVRVAIERVGLRFAPETLRWVAELAGRSFGLGVGAISLPIPPPVVIPGPSIPPITPPIPPVPPVLDVAVALGYWEGSTFTVKLLEDLTATTWQDIAGSLTSSTHVSIVIFGAHVVAAVDGGVYTYDGIAWTALPAPLGYSYNGRTFLQKSGNYLLLDIWNGWDCYGWVIDTDLATSSLTFAGRQTVPMARHLSWAGSQLHTGHCNLDDDTECESEIVEDEDKVCDISTTIVGDNVAANINLDLDPSDSSCYYYALANCASRMRVENTGGGSNSVNLRFQVLSSQYSVWCDGTWKLSCTITKSVTIPPGGTDYLEGEHTFLLRVTNSGVSVDSRAYAGTGSSNISLQLARVCWEELGKEYIAAGDPVRVWHVDVPLGSEDDPSDYAPACCTFGTDPLEFCPDWADGITVKPDTLMLVDNGANIEVANASNICATPTTSGADTLIDFNTQGRNVVLVGSSLVALNRARDSLLISTDDFVTYSTVSLPSFIGTAFGSVANYGGTYAVVFGTDGVGLYNLSSWTDITGDLALTSPVAGYTSIGA